MNTNKTERENNQLVPFNFGACPVRAIMRDGEPWFVAKDVCDVLRLGNITEALRGLDEDEKSNLSNSEVSNIPNRGVNIINESGVYNLVFRSNKPEAKAFRKWVTTVVLPSIRKTGAYAGAEAAAGEVYRLFSSCHDMTLQRVNKLMYLLALEPPLSNTDISILMAVSTSTITYWRKRLRADMARNAVAALGINAHGIAALENRAPASAAKGVSNVPD
jgi:prophage antirepressor-like protein